MGLEVYYPADVRNALLAAEQAVNAAAQVAGGQNDPFAAGFLKGYRAALATIALAFGLVRPDGQEKERYFWQEPGASLECWKGDR